MEIYKNRHKWYAQNFAKLEEIEPKNIPALNGKQEALSKLNKN